MFTIPNIHDPILQYAIRQAYRWDTRMCTRASQSSGNFASIQSTESSLARPWPIFRHPGKATPHFTHPRAYVSGQSQPPMSSFPKEQKEAPGIENGNLKMESKTAQCSGWTPTDNSLTDCGLLNFDSFIKGSFECFYWFSLIPIIQMIFSNVALTNALCSVALS